MSTSYANDAPTVVGAQRPQRLHLPPEELRVSSAGVEAVELAASAGLFYDPWQEFALECALWERPDGKWSAFEVAVIVARQNGKGSILEGRELFGMFLAEEELILHSAHEFKTAQEAFLRIQTLIESNRDFSRRLAPKGGITTAHGDEGIQLRPSPRIITDKGATGGRAPRLRFVARTGGSGRGFTGDCVIWDEAFNLPERAVGALMPTLSARQDMTPGGPQLWYASSPVNREEHDNGITLARVRKRALAGDDPSMAYLEWQADEAEYWRLYELSPKRARAWMGQREQWLRSNPGAGYRVNVEHIAREYRSMGAKTFAVERLSIGDWPEVDQDETAVDMLRWELMADPESRPVGRIALAIDVSPDRRRGAIASAGRRADDRIHVKVVDHRPGTGWIVQRVVDLWNAYDVCVIVIDGRSPAASLVADIEDAGVPMFDAKMPHLGGVKLTSATDMARAYGSFVDDIDAEHDGMRHCDQEALNDALREADTRALGDATAWDRKKSGADITTLVAVTLAAHGFRVHGSSEGVEPWAEYV